MPARIVTDAMDARIRVLAPRGVPDSEIGRELGLNTTTVQAWRSRHGIASTWKPAPRKHSPWTTPVCRCSGCLAARSAKVSELRRTVNARTGGPGARRAREPWQPHEDVAALDRTRPIEEIARALGRSYLAVVNRRRVLTKEAR
ncbi:hypothetical protein [Cellulosimicrobium protaetiae]